MKGVYFILLSLAFYFFGIGAFAQVVSISDGDWDDPNIWNPIGVPDFNSGQIEVNHVVTIQTGFSYDLDQTTIGSTGHLIISSGSTVRILNGLGSDFTINPGGFLDVSGILEGMDLSSIIGTSSLNTTFLGNSTFRHRYTSTEGSIPIANWSQTSNLEILGYNTTVIASSAGNWSQQFGNVVFNCSALNSRGILLQSFLNNIAGNLTISSTGNNGWLELTRGQSATINIQGNLIVSNASRFYVTSNGNVNLNIGEDFIYNSTSVYGSYTTITGTSTINIGGDFLMNAPNGLLRVAINASSFGQTTFNIAGNFVLTTGKLEEFASNGVGIINFVGSNTHLFSNTGQITNNFNYYVSPTSTLDLGTSALTGSGTFTLDGTLIVRSTSSSGALSSTSASGNIQLPLAQRFYNSGSTIIYGGTSPQTISSGHPSDIGVGTVINNSSASGVTLVNNITFNGDLTLQQGQLTMGNYSIQMNGSNWLVNNGTLNFGVSGTVTFGGNTTIGGSSIPSFRHIIISGGSSCTLSNDLYFLGNLTIQPSASLNTNSFDLRLTGNPDQVISANGATIIGLSVNKTGGSVILNSSLNLLGTLRLLSTTSFNSSGFLTLLSLNDNPAQDGNIAALPAAASISGNVTVQRYMSTADNFDRFLSMPISNATVAQLQDDFSVTGNFTGTSFPCTGCNSNGPSLKRYNEAITGIFSNGYIAVPAAGMDNTAALIAGVGYDSYMWNGVSPITWDVTGTINRGTINFAVSHTASIPAEPSADGWNLVGNPYPSAIQWNNGAGWSRTNIDPTVWVWDVVGRVWHSYNANTQTGDLTDGIIAMGQGFWVYAPTPGAASMSINEQAKSTAGSGSYYRQSSSSEDISLKVSLSKGGVTDNAFLIMRDEATQTFDPGLDCPKLELGIERMHISLVEDSKHLAYYAVNNTFDLDIPVRITAEESGNYELSVASTGGFSAHEKYYLVDLELEKSIPLSSLSNSKYSFTYEKGQSEERFLLTQDPQQRKSGTQLTVDVFPNPTTGDFSVEVKGTNVRKIIVLNNAGIQLEQVNSFETAEGLIKQPFSLTGQPKGIYLLKIVTDNTVIVKRISKN